MPIVPTTVKRSPLVKNAKQCFQIEYKRESLELFCKAFQLVFQQKIKTDINHIKQYDKGEIQITPAQQAHSRPAISFHR